MCLLGLFVAEFYDFGKTVDLCQIVGFGKAVIREADPVTLSGQFVKG